MNTQKNKFGKMLSLVLSLFMVATFTLLSCGSDDGDGGGGSSNSYVILDGKKYGMNGGYPAPPAYYIEIDNVGNKSVTLILNNGYPDTRDFSISFYGLEYEELNSGTYTFYPGQYTEPGYNPEEHFAIGYDDSIIFEYDCTDTIPKVCTEASLTSGTVTITKSGTDNIIIDFDGMTDKGAIKAYYEGTIKDLGSIEF